MAMCSLTIVCNAPYGGGGQGQHLAQVVEDSQDLYSEIRYYCALARADDPRGQAISVPRWVQWLSRIPPWRMDAGLRGDLVARFFQKRVLNQLKMHGTLLGFSGCCRSVLQSARRSGVDSLQVESPTLHGSVVRRQLDKARNRYPLEHSWMGQGYYRNTLVEYELADSIWVNSNYARETFLHEGVPEGKLRVRRLRIHPRFRPPEHSPDNTKMHIVYTGSLTVAKGVPLLLEAFAAITDPEARLTLVGGTGSRGMRQYVESALSRDPRIRVVLGDPLPVLQSATVYVHPSFSDGYGYAPMEALACGIPVIVSADTGMKDCVVDGVNGYVVPTGSVEAIVERLRQLRRDPIGSVPNANTHATDGRK